MTQCPDGSVNRVSVGYLIDTYPFPPIFLFVQFHGGTIRRCNEIRCGILREAAKVTLLVLGKEGDVSHFEFFHLL